MTRVGVIGGYCQLLEALKEQSRREKLYYDVFEPLFRGLGRAAMKRDRRARRSKGGRR